MHYVLHSPTTSSVKWWPGGLGRTSNCAVVMAQLIIRGICHGVQLFFIIFRDLETHEPLPGITVGDIGPKAGFETNDNGFLRFDNFRIPRDNMLMKHAQVLPGGRFVINNPHQKRPVYGTLTSIRTTLVNWFGYKVLAIAVTIAIRYSAVRRQSQLRPDQAETQVLDYRTQQYKLFPYLAMSYAFKFVHNKLRALYESSAAPGARYDESLVAELHALSSCLKAYSTESCLSGVEAARTACGGHGYSLASGLPRLYNYTAAFVSGDGENTVLYLQTARYLVKCASSAIQGHRDKLAPSVSYLADAGRARSRCLIDGACSLYSLTTAVEHRARKVILDAARALQQETVSQKGDVYTAWNNCGVSLVKASRAHCQHVLIQTFVREIQTMQDSRIRNVMTQLCELLALYYLDKESADLLEDGYMTSSQRQLVVAKLLACLGDLRHNAVSLVDAFDFPDALLCSMLGRYDGNVYENLYKWALQSPLNRTQVHESFHQYTKPALKSRL